MVRRAVSSNRRSQLIEEVSSNDSGDNVSSDNQGDDSDYGVRKTKSPTKSGKKKAKKSTPRGKISPAKTPASKIRFSEDSDDEDTSLKSSKSKRNSVKRSIDFDQYSPSSKRAKSGNNVKYNYDDDSDDLNGDQSDDDEVPEPSPKKRGRPKSSPQKTQYQSEEEFGSSDNNPEEQESDDGYVPTPSPRKRGRPKLSPQKTQYQSEEELGSSDNNPEEQESDNGYVPAPSPRKRGRPKLSPQKTQYQSQKELGSSDNNPEEQESDDGYMPTPSPRKRGRPKSSTKKKRYVSEDEDDDEPRYKPSKKSPAKKSKSKPGRKSLTKKPRYVDYSESEESVQSESDEEPQYKPKKKGYMSSKRQISREDKKPSKEPLPKTSEMVVESIKALQANPKKGSTLGHIKETIVMNWPVNMNSYDKKIKKFILNAIETGEIIRVKGKGFNGRFTVPGMKIKRKKKKAKLSKKFDEDEVEYQPAKTRREEDKEQTQEELERLRNERKILQEKKLAEMANRTPKKRRETPKDTEYEVEAIKGIKRNSDGSIRYLVKFAGWSKPQWEGEHNVEGCQDLIDAYIKIKEEKDAEKKRAEEEGSFEVSKILSMRKKAGHREFLIRWKGFSCEDDTWEPEDNLDCDKIISDFVDNWEKMKDLGGRSMRECPKVVERLQYASSRREAKRGGFRVSYVGMDD